MQGQRDAVRGAEAEALMGAGDPVGAARLWGRVTAAHPPFEDIALRLADSGSPDALHTLLSTKLEALPSQDRAQVCIGVPLQLGGMCRASAEDKHQRF